MQKSSYPPEKITVKVQNNSQSASKKSVFQRLGGKSKLSGDLSLEEQCKELRRQIKMESGGGSSSAKRKAQKRHKESSSSSDDSSSGSSSGSSSSSSSSQSSPTRRRTKKSRKPHHHHSSSSVDHLAAKIRKTATGASSSSAHRSSTKATASSSSSSKKHKSRAAETPPPPSSSSRRRSASPASPHHRSSRHHHHHQSSSSAHDLKKRDHHRSKEALSSKDSRLHHEATSSTSRARSRSPRHRDLKRRSSLTRHSPRASSSRSVPRSRSVERDRERREKEREEREIARNKEREEALLRCQERQRERERLALERERKEKSLDRQMHERRSGGRGNYERSRATTPGAAYEGYERTGDTYSHRSASGVRSSAGHREGSIYEKEYPRGSVVRERSPYDEASAGRAEKYRSSSGYDYEPPRSGRGYATWEEEKAHKPSGVAVGRERKDWGPGQSGGYRGSGAEGQKDWGGSGGASGKWETQKFGSGGSAGVSREGELWRGESQHHHPSAVGGKPGEGPGNWRTSSGYQEEGAASWKEGGSGSAGHFGYSQGQSQSGASPSGPRLLGPRYSDSWHHKPRFGGKKEFYPRHQFGAQHEGGAPAEGQGHARYPGQKRFGEYQHSFAPRGAMNQGPKFNAPTHGQSQQSPTGGQTTAKATVTVEPSKTTPTAEVSPVEGESKDPAKIEDVGTPTEDEKKTGPREEGGEEGDNLSEFSDDGDEILDKNDELRQSQQSVAEEEANGDAGEGEVDKNPVDTEAEAVKREVVPPGEEDDDLTLDFEEISDGELEEDSSKVKGLGDALGVDWAGLVAATEPRDRRVTGDLKANVKEMWEPRRIFQDVGISVRMAGRELAEKLLGHREEEGEVVMMIKREPGLEGAKKEGEVGENGEVVVKVEKQKEVVKVDLDANPIASCQVAVRRALQRRSNLIVNRSGVALCARRDLQIRRQLCGLSAEEVRGTNSRLDEQQQTELKAMALAVFARATAAVH